MAHSTRVSRDTPAEIVTTRLPDAPVALVWRAFTESDQVVQWWGPVGLRQASAAAVLAPESGGNYWHPHYFLWHPHFFPGGAPEWAPKNGGGGNIGPC